MKIKNTGSHTREIIFMATASALAIGLIVYCLYLVASISNKATSVFGEETLEGAESKSFDFEAYDRLVLRLYPGSTTMLSSTQALSATEASPAEAPTGSSTTTTSTQSKP